MFNGNVIHEWRMIAMFIMNGLWVIDMAQEFYGYRKSLQWDVWIMDHGCKGEMDFMTQ